jgi:hypothetical protein
VRKPGPAPSWKNTSWPNAPGPIALEDLRGLVVLLSFWVYHRGNCTRTLPSQVDFPVLVGIHTPESRRARASTTDWPSFVLIDEQGAIRTGSTASST